MQRDRHRAAAGPGLSSTSYARQRRSSIIPTVHNDDEVFGGHSASQGIFVTEMDKDKPLRIPALRHHVEQFFKFTDPFCGEHLDAEYAELIRKLIAKLARKRPSPLVRGDLRIWAAAAIYAVGSVNFLIRPRAATPPDRSRPERADWSTEEHHRQQGEADPRRSAHRPAGPGVLPAGATRVEPDVLDDFGRRHHRGRAHNAAGGPSGGMAAWSDP